MKYDLAALARRARSIRRKSITLRDIIPPAVLATNLFQRCYSPVVSHWTAAIPRIMAEYERTLSTMTTDSPADVQREIGAAESGFLRLILFIEPKLRDWAVSTERWWRGRWRGAVLSATGVDLDTLIGPEDVRDTLEVTIARNVALVKDVSQQAQQRMSDAVFRGLTQRKPAQEVAAELREAVAMGRARSIRIASDQMTKLTSALADERQAQAGIDTVEWRSSHKRHPRPHHAARDGKLYDRETRRAIDGSETVPADDWVSRPPFCGCRTLSRISFD